MLPFLIPALASLTAKTLGTIITTTVVSTTTAAVTHDAYQKLKASARSSDDNKQNRN